MRSNRVDLADKIAGFGAGKSTRIGKLQRGFSKGAFVTSGMGLQQKLENVGFHRFAPVPPIRRLRSLITSRR